MTRRSRWAGLAAGLVAGLLTTATACTDDRLEPADQTTPGVADTAGPARHPGLYSVNSQTLGGTIVIDVQGYALYRYDRDSTDPSRSACVGECVRTWRPVPAGDLAALKVVGMDRGKVGKVTRPDGSEQLTFWGWPLYGYAGDRMPGDTLGHRLDDVWFVISPSGLRAGRPGTA